MRLLGRVEQTSLFSLHSVGKQPQEPVYSRKVPLFHPPIQVPSLGSGPSDNSRDQVYWHPVTNTSSLNPRARDLRVPLLGWKSGALDTHP